MELGLDIIKHICLFLDVKDVINLLRTNKILYKIDIWNKLFIRDFPRTKFIGNINKRSYISTYRKVNDITELLIQEFDRGFWITLNLKENNYLHKYFPPKERECTILCIDSRGILDKDITNEDFKSLVRDCVAHKIKVTFHTSNKCKLIAEDIRIYFNS